MLCGTIIFVVQGYFKKFLEAKIILVVLLQLVVVEVQVIHGVVCRCWGVTVVVGVAPPVPWHLLLHPLARAGHFTLLAFESGGGGLQNMFSLGHFLFTDPISIKAGPPKKLAETSIHQISSMYQYVKSRHLDQNITNTLRLEGISDVYIYEYIFQRQRCTVIRQNTTCWRVALKGAKKETKNVF